MKYFLLITLLTLNLISIGCAQKKADDTSTTDTGGGGGGGGGGTPKDLLSLWTISNSAWTIDLSAGNVAGTQFNVVVSVGSTVSCNCPTTMTGTTSSGTCTAPSSCTLRSGSWAGTTGDCASHFDNICNGSYSNDGTNLQIGAAVYH